MKLQIAVTILSVYLSAQSAVAFPHPGKYGNEATNQNINKSGAAAGSTSSNDNTNVSGVDSNNTNSATSGVLGSGNSSNQNGATSGSSASGGRGTGIGVGQGGTSNSESSSTSGANGGNGTAVSGPSVSGATGGTSNSRLDGNNTIFNQTETSNSSVRQEAIDIPIQLAPLPPNTNPTASVVCKYLQAQLSYTGGKSGGISVFNLFGIQGSRTPDKLPKEQKGILQAIATCGVVDQINSISSDMPIDQKRAIQGLAIEKLFRSLEPISGYQFRASDLLQKKAEQVVTPDPASKLSNYQRTMERINDALDARQKMAVPAKY